MKYEKAERKKLGKKWKLLTVKRKHTEELVQKMSDTLVVVGYVHLIDKIFPGDRG